MSNKITFTFTCHKTILATNRLYIEMFKRLNKLQCRNTGDNSGYNLAVTTNPRSRRFSTVKFQVVLDCKFSVH